MTVFETYGLPSSGLHGTTFNTGLFDECQDFSYGKFQGKYCVAEMKSLTGGQLHPNGRIDMAHIFRETILRADEGYKLGVCVPRTCSAQQAKFIGNKVLAGGKFQLQDVTCYEPMRLYDFEMSFM